MNSDNLLKTKKLIISDIVFLVLSFPITFLMFSLWFWLFSNKVVLSILIIFTLLGLIKYVWKNLGDLATHWKLYKKQI